MKNKKYRLTYRLYKQNYEGTPEEITVVTEEPMEYIERIRADLAMTRPDMHVGTYVIEPIKHLEVVK